MNAALETGFGNEVVLLCDENNAVNEIYYPFNIRGSFQYGMFQTATNIGLKTNCPSTVWYLPKYGEGSLLKAKGID